MIGQGTISGALVSQAVLDDAVSEEFPPAGKLQIEYGSVPMAPLLYMDDIQNSAPELEEARFANVKFNRLLKRRGLALNKEKSIMVVALQESKPAVPANPIPKYSICLLVFAEYNLYTLPTVPPPDQRSRSVSTL